MSSFCKSYSHFFSKKFQHICVSLDVNFNESLTNDVVSFEQLGSGQLINNFVYAFTVSYFYTIKLGINARVYIIRRQYAFEGSIFSANFRRHMRSSAHKGSSLK